MMYSYLIIPYSYLIIKTFDDVELARLRHRHVEIEPAVVHAERFHLVDHLGGRMVVVMVVLLLLYVCGGRGGRARRWGVEALGTLRRWTCLSRLPSRPSLA